MHHGRGVMTNPDGYIYDGDWINGVKEGAARITYPDGTIMMAASCAARARSRAA